MLNAAQFSAAKSAAEAKILQTALFDADKNFLPYSKFNDKAKEITNIFQETWLRVEYDMCKRQTVQGEAFRQMKADADLYPYWVYHGVMDDREREEHVEMEGLVFRIGDPAGDAVYPPADWNCRCSGDPVDDQYLEENNLRPLTNDEAEEVLNTKVDEQFRYNPAEQGMLPKTGSYFDVVGSANELDFKNFDLPSAVNHPSIIDDEVAKLTSAQLEEFKNFERDNTLTGEDAALQEKSILAVVTKKDKLVDEYLKENGNVVNTDSARVLFKDLGYRGSNSAAVHEASSLISKEALKKLEAVGKNDHISFYAGGSGAGKTSTIDKIFPELGKKSDAVIDGNLSNYAKAVKQMNKFLEDRKTVDIVYVYRPPEEAWKGVIHRMLHNKKEMGRLVPMSTFLKNTEGSYRTIEGMFKAEVDKIPGVRISIMDNSLGAGKAEKMKREKFNNLKFDKDLEEKVRKITKEYYDKGEITEEQFIQLNQ